MTSTDPRAAYIEGLRQLAAALAAHPEIPLPYNGAAKHGPLIIGFHGAPDEAREEMAAAVRALPCSFTKQSTDNWLTLNGQLAGVHVQLYAARDAVCTRRVTGVEEQEVEEEVTPAVTRKVTKRVEVVEWDCGPVLGKALDRAPEAALPPDLSGDPAPPPVAGHCPICGGEMAADGSHISATSGARIPATPAEVTS